MIQGKFVVCEIIIGFFAIVLIIQNTTKVNWSKTESVCVNEREKIGTVVLQGLENWKRSMSLSICGHLLRATGSAVKR